MDVKKVKEEVSVSKLWMYRVPRKAKRWFVKFAEEEFEDDYGMALKHLCDFYQGCFPTGHEIIEAKIETLSNEIENIKKILAKPKKEKEEKPERKRLDGTVR